MELSAVTSEFLNHCRTKGLSPHTLRAYSQDLRDFASWSAVARHDPVLTKAAIEAWVEDLRARNHAPTSIRRRFSCLKVFCRWLEENENLVDNPFDRLRTSIRIPKRLPRHLSVHEITALLGSANWKKYRSPNFKQLTLALAIELLFTTGIRVGELCGIRLKDIDIPSGIITIRGKGNRERRVFIVDEPIKQSIADYVSKRDALAPDTDSFLVTTRGTKTTPDYIRKALHFHTKTHSFQRRITPHMLRHTAATQLLENGLDIRFVQKLLGHASISTTEIYTHVSDTCLQEAVRVANPIGRLR